MSDLGQATSENRTEGAYPAALAGATSEIKELFSTLTGQLHSAERRYGEAMAEMEKRLALIEKRASAAARAQSGPETWDSDSAEALARAYESQDPGFVHQTPVADPNRVLGPRIAGISARIKRSLGEMRPQSALPAIEHRFDSFEQRIGAAVRDFARRSDVEGLQFVEQNVRELGDRLDIVQTQLTRLDRIETQINGLMDRLSDERLADVLAQDGRFAASLETVARLAADEVHARMAAPAAVGAVDDGGDAAAARYEELRSLIEKAIIEQRQGEQNTSTLFNGLGGAMTEQADRYEEFRDLFETSLKERREGDEQIGALLDTLQQALVQVLDRMDALEAGMQDAALLHAEPATPPPVPVPVAARAAEEAAQDQTPVEAYQPGLPAVTEEEPPIAEKAAPALPAAPVVQTEAQVEAPVASADKVRRDFIVDAQRAKLKAQSQRAQADLGASRPEPRPAKVAAGQGRLLNLSPMLLAGALALVVAVNGGLLLMARKAAVETPPPPPAAAQSVEPAHEPAAFDENTDLLLDDSEIAAGGAKDALASPAPKGIVLFHPPEPYTTEELAYVYEQQAQADLSAEVGANAAKATFASLLPEGPATEAPANDIAAGDNRNTLLDLPPATVGPLSLRLAAAKGDPSAEFEVGSRLAEGKGTDQNMKEALRWYQKAAARGFAQAQYRLGTLFERGLGVGVDIKRARIWYQRSAKQGNVKAMHNLAVLSANGQAAGAEDYAAALDWFTQAADYGLPDSQYNLGIFYDNGLGIQKDAVVAYKWYALAANAGDKDAIQRRDQMKRELAAPDLDRAEALVRGFVARQPDKLVNDAHAAGEDWKNRQASES